MGKISRKIKKMLHFGVMHCSICSHFNILTATFRKISFVYAIFFIFLENLQFTRLFYFREIRVILTTSEKILSPFGIEYYATYITYLSFDYVILVLDLFDEILEFINLTLVTLFWPFFYQPTRGQSFFRYYLPI